MEINRNNYEEFFLLYVDNELPAGERREVEEFVHANPDLKVEFDLLSDTVLVADNNIVFEEKEALYKEEERKVVSIVWWRIAAAAVLLFGLGTFGWLYLSNETVQKPVPVAAMQQNTVKEQKDAVKNELRVTEPLATQAKEATNAEKPAIIKTETPAVKKERIKQNPEPLPLVIEPEIAKVEEEQPPVDVAVTPRKLDDEINNVAVAASLQKTPMQQQAQTQPEYVQIADDNVYFANTAVSKRNKFRGVFRKATRILDKVTSFQ